MTTAVENVTFTEIPPLRWETIECNLCGADNTRIYHRETLPYFDKIVDFEIVQCRECGLVYTNPRLSDYNAPYLFTDGGGEEKYESHAQAKSPVFQSALKQIKEWQSDLNGNTGGSLLDMGSGTGHFMQAAIEQGFDSYGIEPAPASADYAINQLGMNVFHDDIYTIDLPQNHYDVITAWDVIEHVSDPKTMLERCYTWLKPGGIMALRFPSSTWQKIKGVILHQILSSKRPSFGPTMHLYFFDEKTFKRMAEDAGFDILEILTTAAEANTNNLVLDGIKVVSNYMIRGIEMCTRRHLGNLEVYCRKGK